MGKIGATRYTNASVSGLEYGKTYYWQNVAKNASKDFEFSHKSSIYSFSTERALLITEIKREKNMINFQAENKKTAASAFTVIAAARDNDGKLLAVECKELDVNQKGIFEKSVKLENEILVNAEK